MRHSSRQLRSCLHLVLAGLVLLPVSAGADSLETALMPGQVIQGHAKWEEDCRQCHKRFDKEAQTQLCLTCHKTVATDVRQRRRLHGRLGDRQCRECHTEHKGRTAPIAPVNERTFDHARTDFPLRGAHGDATKAGCRSCHKPAVKYRDTPSACIGCHKKDDRHKGGLGERCANCHTDRAWKEVRFDHSKTRYPLLGKHLEVACAACHAKERYKGTPTDCVACHRKDDYHKGVLGRTCEVCHEAKDWKASTFDHDRDTKYRLKGRHARVKCESCHTSPIMKAKTPTQCLACHKRDDVHKGRFGPRCQACHAENSWKALTFDHARDTKYPLRDKHRRVKCEACHTGNPYKERLKTACIACHSRDDTHKGRFGSKCERCHTESSWKTTGFDHERDTTYPLRGKHRTATCKGCHTGDLYKDKLQTTCAACHRTDDTHKGTYGATCHTCHTERDWKTILFDHDRDTTYRLRDKHRPLKCEICHKGPLYTVKLRSTCVACHQKDDKHKGQEGSRCENCHNERSWKDTRFDHGLTAFPLLGKHEKLACLKCHATRAFKDAPVECVGCHAKADVHRQRLGTRCEACHDARDWTYWDFDHATRTRFVLDGAHRSLPCEACHKAPMGRTVRVAETCAGCHRRDDVHEGSFGQQCERCHETTRWDKLKPGSTGGATFLRRP